MLLVLRGLNMLDVTDSNEMSGGAPGARPPKIGKNMIFFNKIVIFHTKYPNNFRTSLHSAQIS
jgi:hypothetical protein